MNGTTRDPHGSTARCVLGLTLVCALGVGCSSGDTPTGRGSGNSSAPVGTVDQGGGSGALGAIPDGITPDAGTVRTQGTAGMSLPPGEMPSCAQGMANTSPVTPTVWLVLDGSGSMNTGFDGGQTRWQALRSALMDPGGVVDTLQHVVRFGMVLYSGDRTAATQDQCVQLVTVDPALDNFSNLDTQYPAKELGGYTPTDRALEYVVNTLPVTTQNTVDVKVDPVFVILATDGAPNDRCMGAGSGLGGRNGGLDPAVAQRVLDQVSAGAKMGMKLLVISLAGDDMQLSMHLDDVVAASGSGTPPFVPASKDDLVSTLQQIVGNASCRVALDGTVPKDQGCSGQVTLNGAALACDSPDGYQLLDESTIQLTGSACDTFLSKDSLVDAKFPCNVFVPF